MPKCRRICGAWLIEPSLPYDFVRKRLGVVVEESGQRKLITKGALNNVLAVCTAVAGANGTKAPLDDTALGALRERYATWSGQGYRVLGVATAPVASGKTPPHPASTATYCSPFTM